MFKKKKLDRSSASRSASVDRRSIDDQPSLPVSRQLCLVCFFLFSLLTEGVNYPRSIPLFRERLIFLKFVCLGKLFSDQSESLRIAMHVNAPIVSELSLLLIQ